MRGQTIGVLMMMLVAGLGVEARGMGLPPARNPSGSVMRKFETPYYLLYTDLGEAEAREADLRMTRMFEEYQRRTTGFAGQMKGKFPFYLFKNRSDFLAAGAPEGSAGVYIESGGASWLMAIAGEHTSAYTWHIVQHEGFHQFIAGTIPNDIPIWANEGLAEYFGEAIWTGDGFVSGLVPQERLTEVQGAIREHKFKPFIEMMGMSQQEWGSKLEYSNYTQAWAMVHFLANADGGKYQAPFVQFMMKVSRGADPPGAWRDVFGPGTAAFQARFTDYWLNMPENPTRSSFMKALVQTETSFYARALLQKQTFPDAVTFFKGYKPADLSLNRDLWLPPALFQESSAAALKVGEWTVELSPGAPGRLVCRDRDGTKYVGAYTVANGKVERVWVDVVGGPGRGAGIGQKAAPSR